MTDTSGTRLKQCLLLALALSRACRAALIPPCFSDVACSRMFARPGLNSSAPDAPQEFLDGPDDEEDEAPKSEEDKRNEAQEWQAHNFAK